MMATSRIERKFVAVSSEPLEKTRNSNSQNTPDPEIAREYISQVSEEIGRRVNIKPSKELSRTESRILGALSKLDECFLSPQVRTCSIVVPGKSRNNDSESREPTKECSLSNRCPRAMFSTYQSTTLNDSELE